MTNTITTIHQGEFKDRLFKFIFGKDTEQSKQWRLQLYNKLNDTNYSDPDALKLNTIENVIYITMHNDISFLVDSQMNLYEEQSSRNPNMPLRGLLYYSQLYQIYLTENEKTLITSQLVKIPSPQFVVFYTGTENDPERWTLKLSDSFICENKTGDFEWTATVLNLHPKYTESLKNDCKPLYDYIQYVYRIKQNQKSGMNKDEAIEEAVDWAIQKKLLGDFFSIQKAEVIGMSLTEFDEELCYRTWREDGRTEKAVEDAMNALSMKLSADQVVKITGLPIEKVLELQKSIPVEA